MSTRLPESGIVLAPLAGGPTTPELAAAVTDAGGLGFLAAGYLTPEVFADQIRQARALTPGVLGANLFCVHEEVVHEEAIAAYAAELAPEATRLGVELGQPRFDDDDYAAKLAVVLEASLEVVSFTFGCPSTDDIARLQTAGAEVWVTVTSAAEAIDAAACGADVLVVQGAEAGGHRGAWRDDGTDLPLLELLADVRDACDTPLVATGGIGDTAGVARGARCRRGGRPGRHRVSPLSGGRHERAASSACSRVPASRRSPAPSQAAGRAGSSTSSCASIRTLRRRTRRSTT